MNKLDIKNLTIEEASLLISQFKAYKQGCIDTCNALKEITKDSINYYNNLIKECELQLIKLRMGNYDTNHNTNQANILHS